MGIGPCVVLDAAPFKFRMFGSLSFDAFASPFLMDDLSAMLLGANMIEEYTMNEQRMQ